MTARPIRILLVSDMNLGNLASTLGAAAAPSVSVTQAPFGAVLPTLLDREAPVWSEHPDLSLIWTTPEAVLPSIAQTLAGARIPAEAIDDEVDTFAAAVESAASRSRWTLVPTWLPTFGTRGLGALDLHDASGLRALLARANHRLLTHLRSVPDCWVMDAHAWAETAGNARGDRRLWYAAKIPFPTPVFRAASRDVRAFLGAVTGQARKVILLDLDNTLWGGVVGETGWEGIRLGGHDAVGEAFVDFQRALKALTRRGVILAIVSKNEENVALEAIRQHPDMVLREEDFAGWRINWQDKGTNAAELLDELRLGADAAVFIDDQPAERGRVAAALPDVLVPEWPVDPLGAVDALEQLACFDVLKVSDEDAARAESYAAERQRRVLKQEVTNFEDWLVQLGVTVRIEELSPANLPRAAQLLNKTNQMNLSTRRLSESEVREWAAAPGRSFFTVRVADRFSDFGLTGLLSLERYAHTVSIVDFVLSCRVMSRRVEEAMVHAAVVYAANLGAEAVTAVHVPTPRNQPMLAFWQERSGFSAGENGSFEWRFRTEYPEPPGIVVEREFRTGAP